MYGKWPPAAARPRAAKVAKSRNGLKNNLKSDKNIARGRTRLDRPVDRGATARRFDSSTITRIDRQ